MFRADAAERGGQRRSPGRPSFLTWRLASGQRPLEPRERDVVARALLHGNGGRFHLLAFVVMDDHVHVLARPGDWTLERSLQSWLSSTTQQLEGVSRRRGRIWQQGAGLQPVRNAEELRTLEYRVIGNPWKRWPFLKGYRWVWEVSDG